MSALKLFSRSNSSNTEASEAEGHWAQGVRTDTTQVAVSGLMVIALFVGIFGVWASLAPLDGAVVAPAVITAAGRNQQIAHLEGGIVRQIFVREGEHIKRGQALIEMDTTAAEVLRNRLKKQLVGLRARMARLIANRDGHSELAFTEALWKAAQLEGMSEILSEQEREFAANLNLYRREKSILMERSTMLQNTVEGMRSQQQSIRLQLEIIEEETARKASLLDKGLTTRSEYTALLRTRVQLVGQLGQAMSDILAAETQIAEASQQLARLDAQRLRTAVTQLNEVRAEVTDKEEQLRAAEGMLNRTIVRSMSDGIIVRMMVNSEGSVVVAGKKLIEIVPLGETLIVEARVRPADVGAIRVGEAAEIKFVEHNARNIPAIKVQVTYLSADLVIDPSSSEKFYVARLRIADDFPAGLSIANILPGMPVQVYFHTGARTFVEYLFEPILDSLNRAFRE